MNRHEMELQPPDRALDADALVLALGELDRSRLPLVGGKAAQLGELIHAGFAVPAGFCVTTTAYAHVSASAGLDAFLAELRTSSSSTRPRWVGEISPRLGSCCMTICSSRGRSTPSTGQTSISQPASGWRPSSSALM